MTSPIIEVLAVGIIATAIVNLYFVFDGGRLYFRSSSRSPILLAFFVVKIAVWLAGVFAGWIAWNVLTGRPALPYSGVLLGFVILEVSLLPGFIHLTMRRITKYEAERDVARDEERDVARDELRDPERDELRDAGRDEGRDVIRDPARDSARDAEQEAEPNA